MGLSSFPVVSSGWLPILIINTALSIAVVKNIFRSVLRIIGFRGNGEEEPAESVWPYEEDSVLECASAELPATVEEIRDSLPVTLFECSSAANTECAVCLSKFNGEDEIRTLPCCHLFHKICLDKWLDHDRITCPLCRLCLVPELRRGEEDLAEELIVWFSSFH